MAWYQCYDYVNKKRYWSEEPCPEWSDPDSWNPFTDPTCVWDYWAENWPSPGEPPPEPPPAYVPPAPPETTTYPFGARLPNSLCLELGDCVPCWSPGASADPTPLCEDPFAEPEPPPPGNGNGGGGSGGAGIAILLVGLALVGGLLTKK